MTTTQTTASLIAEAISQADRSVAWVAAKACLAPTSLRRKIRGERDFTVSEVGVIAGVLGIRPSTLLPPEFSDPAAPAAPAA